MKRCFIKSTVFCKVRQIPINYLGRTISSRAGVWVWVEVLPVAPFLSDIDVLRSRERAGN